MRPLSCFRLCAIVCLLGLLAAACGCSSRHNPWVNPEDQGSYLAEKVKGAQNAYLRFAEAEEEARREGNPTAVEKYRQAKDASRQEYERYEKELARYEAERGLRTARSAP